MSNGPSLSIQWLFKMAWRDGRRRRSRLFLFISSIILGIAALVAIYSFGDNLKRDIDDQAAGLLGADLSISNNRPVSDRARKLLDSLGDERAREQSFASMVFFPANGGTRLVQIRALEGNYPWYGRIETSPVNADKEFRTGKFALVDKTVMLQFKAKNGDSIRVGNLSFLIRGTLEKAPGQTGISSSVAPVVYIPFRYLEQTGLLQKGSRVNYRFYYKFKDVAAVSGLVKKISPRLEKEGLDHDTIESQKEDTGRSFRDLTRFLSLVGFVALLLGCIGVASSIHIYMKEKIGSIAILRCLGLKGWQAFLIYLIQIAGIGFAGSVAGAILGTVIQQVLPLVLKEILPVVITTAISWSAIFQGIVLGMVISVLFALLPLISIRSISPLNTLRITPDGKPALRDPFRWLVYILILLFIVLFSYVQLHDWKQALVFTASVLSAFGILAGIASLMIIALKRFFPYSLSYLWRQGLANLFRPNNQTLILVLAIGLGTAFIGTLIQVRRILTSRISLSASGNQPNMVLFDIQGNQKKEIRYLTEKHGLPIIQEVPIITVRLDEIKGKTALDVKKDSSLGISPRAFNAELRVTFRDSLTASEKVTDGKWQGKADADGVYVSLEEGYAKRISVAVGDPLLFNVQGALIPARVGSLRQVDWNRIQTNFRIVFPTGVLEDAPQFHVLLTRVDSDSTSVAFQQDVVRHFPNVSVIDLGLVLSVLDEILGKIGFVINFMSAFSIITGLIVLTSSILISKYQRIQESVLLRTLGGSRRQILFITALEYFLLGALAAATGILVSVSASWGLATYQFESPFSVDILSMFVLFCSISLLTVTIGLFNSRGILSRPPLEVLRRDV